MRLVRPMEIPSRGNTGGHFRSIGIPKWLKEWIEDRPRFVLLECGCKDNLAIRGVLYIHSYRDCKTHVYCERCQCYSVVVRTLTANAYFGIELVRLTDHPPF